MIRSTFFIILLLVASAEPAAGRATDRLLEQGIQLYRVGKFSRSLAVLKRARASHEPRNKQQAARIFLYLALNHAIIGDLQRTRTLFDKALRQDPTLRIDSNRYKPAILTLFSDVRSRLRGQLRVTGDLQNAAVRIDGKSGGRLPHTTTVPAGTHIVEVRDAYGDPVFRTKVVVYPDTQRHVVVPQSERPRRAEDRLALSARSNHSPPSTSFWRRPRLWTWIVAGAAALFAVGSLACWVSADSEHDDLSSRYEDLMSRGEGATIAEMKDSIATKDTAADVLVGVSAALFAGSIALLLLEGRPQPKKRRHEMQLSLSPQGVMLTIPY